MRSCLGRLEGGGLRASPRGSPLQAEQVSNVRVRQLKQRQSGAGVANVRRGSAAADPEPMVLFQLAPSKEVFAGGDCRRWEVWKDVGKASGQGRVGLSLVPRISGVTYLH